MAAFYTGLYFLRATEPEEKDLIVKFNDKLKRKHAILKTNKLEELLDLNYQ